MMSTEFEKMLVTSSGEQRKQLMLAHPEYLEEAVELTVANRQPYSWRAAWLVGKYMDENDERVVPYTDRLIKALETFVDGYQRELLKILNSLELNEDQEGYVFDACTRIWKQVSKKPATRYYAIKHILKIAGKHPELMQEAQLLMQNPYMDALSPGVRRSLHKLMKSKGI